MCQYFTSVIPARLTSRNFLKEDQDWFSFFFALYLRLIKRTQPMDVTEFDGIVLCGEIEW